MRKATIIFLLFLIFLPAVSATQVTYYPNKASFHHFLESNSTYRIVAGHDYWSRGWSLYVDSKLSRVKKHGNDVTILVGNVRDNPEIARVWNRTGLPEEVSFEPSLIVMKNVVIITGTEGNIYKTEEAFLSIWRPSREALMLFTAIFTLLFLTFATMLRRDNSHSTKFFIAASSLIFLWFTLSRFPILGKGFQPIFLRGLEVAVGASPRTPLEAILGAFFQLVPPVEENLWLIHWIVILAIAGLLFYVAPRRERELGFIAFGLAFSAPLLRAELDSVTVSNVAILLVLSVIAVASNSAFTPESNVLHTLILAVLTVLASAFNPLFLVIPLVFVTAYPKRLTRNALYLLLVAAGSIPLAMKFQGWLTLSRIFPNVREFLIDSALPFTVIGYLATWERRRIKMKGPTAFLLLLVLVFTGFSFAGFCDPAYAYLFLALLIPRAIHSMGS